MVKVIWIAGRLTPSASWNGLVNSVQTYCGLEIDIIAINPSTSCTHRVDATDPRVSATAVVIVGSPKYKEYPGTATLFPACGGDKASNRAAGDELCGGSIGRRAVPCAYRNAGWD